MAARITFVAASAYDPRKKADPRPVVAGPQATIAIFLERVFERAYFADYQARFFLPNPEWLDPQSQQVARSIIDIMLHKSLSSRDMIAPLFPEMGHHLLGFTSPDPGCLVENHDAFAHFRGKATTRQTQSIAKIWGRRPELPHLFLQGYGQDLNLQIGRWMSSGNMNLYLGSFAEHADYFRDLAKAGIHLCTSQVEGFGHYLNESRAMGATIITLDAPPMNEMVTADSGVLVASEEAAPVHLGKRYKARTSAIEQAIDAVLALGPSARAELGRSARNAYKRDRQTFEDNMRSLLADRFVLGADERRPNEAAL